jgi:aspartyl-tRNA(Asn)/glutamyl-tRNA(Gln) amidotransferase subunit C
MERFCNKVPVYMITRDDVNNLCALARLSISEEEKESLAADMGRIVEYIQQIQSVEIPDDIHPTHTLHNISREDSDMGAPNQYTEILLAEAPERDGQYIKVQKVLGGSSQ